MSALCAVCGKGPQTGYNVSHSHRRTKRRFMPNLQVVRVDAGIGRAAGDGGAAAKWTREEVQALLRAR